MLDIPRLIVARQRRVAQSIGELAADNVFVQSLHPDTRAALAAAVAAGTRLDGGHDLPPLLVDNTSDTVIYAFEDCLAAIERGLSDKVVPLGADQARKRNAARFVRQRAFPDGSGFLSHSMPLQYRAMRDFSDKLREKDCADAVTELGLAWFVAHIDAHLAPYGRAVRTTDNRDLEAESDAFHAAFMSLAVQAAAHHAGDAAIRKQLMSAYETEVEAQRTDERERRRAARKKGEGEGDQ